MSQHKGGKAAAKGKKSGGGGAEEKAEDIVQAVVLADSFQDRFAPFTLEKPRCLLPLANTPLIEYTLEYLAMNGIHEVFIYCGNHTDQVEQYIQDSPRWSPAGHISPFSLLEFVRVNDASSPGDFLRDLDKRGLISGDFILVHGDLVANIPLDNALTAHRRRREANRDAIMTMVLREGGPGDHHTKSRGTTPVFTIEAKEGRCLQFDETNPLQSSHYTLLDPAVFEHDEVEMRTDLIDCEIDICTPDVLALWSDSFDYEAPRKHFLHGVLKDWELNGKLIYTNIVNEGYGARASNLQLYESITRDVISRWTFPMVPDNNLVQGQSYALRRNFVYSEKGVKFEVGSHVEKSVVGMKTTVGTGSTIMNCVIGERCHIGNNVHISDSFIWSDATIEDGARITRSVVASSATVGKDCTIPAGSLISFGVQLSDGVSLPDATTLSLFTRDRLLAETDTKLLGPSGKGSVYQYEDEDEYDEFDPANLQRTLIYSTAHLNISTSTISSFNSDHSDDESDDGGLGGGAHGHLDPGSSSRERHSSMISETSAGSDNASTSFHNDAVTSLVDALRSEDNKDMDGAKLEFMGLRLATDASDAAVRRAIATSLVRAAVELMQQLTGALEPSKAAERALTAKKGTSKFVSEVGVGGDDTADQAAFALALQKAAAAAKGIETGRAGTLLAALLQHLYNLDVLEEEGILAWWKGADAAQGEKMVTVKEKCKVLIDWLQEDDDSDDSDDE
ncbi:uncharacterized protein PpBr36_06656 [Pyricularia pennisetigena]|uniref:uncharacterized protein n=1 Tax=Pyricularia pennisetigena TaxID=1578925 RepID=UPI0011519B6D|nr:uncharacterized protein PpBr36_06656 [Pyricularia pennisetigena]TLS23157.1 hypothetical protein PpBr36_06656 [Pyricularia pennisetigena]